jgi:hypothetical protein
MEKEIPGGILEAVHHDAQTSPEIDVATIMDAAGAPAKTMLATLAALGIVPTPKEFQDIVLTDSHDGEMIKRALGETTFDPNVGGVDDTYAPRASDFSADLAHALEPLLTERSSFSPYIGPRLTESVGKTASAQRKIGSHPALTKLAAQYNGFRIAMLENAPDLIPCACDHLGVDDLDRSGDRLAQLLLGLAAVIQLIAAHLKIMGEGNRIGSMARFVADHRQLQALSTLGSGLRAAMSCDKVSGIADAATTVVTAVTARL